ncbi:hypothetical protein [Psychrosphaera haliotis]|uniref:Outer membrane beta-barrel protein n=1 Tax=Psychrosphaera haliotis TaxID=555083 RepID=A0A6N8F8U0_9GAMM|nr:hypothetical protein [Psychrosphaera haliotis]MUH72584.1 hypothetical protein [Psychrosphaera haliotis]
MQRILLLLILLAPLAHANESPFEWEIQTGALKGSVHAAIGYELASKHFVSLGLGYVPSESDRDAFNIYSLNYMYRGTTEYSFSAWDNEINLKPINFGVSTIYADHEALFFSLPDGIPSGYYAPTALRILFEYELAAEISSDTDVFIKWSVLDVGLINYARNYSFYRDNYELLGLAGISSWGVGIRKAF